MSVRITDCTIRDGGYLLNKNSDIDFVKSVLSGLAEAGIDFVETGFLQSVSSGETLVYADPVEATAYLPEEWGRSQFIGFCDNSRYSAEKIDYISARSLKWIRLSFAKHELESALEFCRTMKDKGYKVQFNPMDAISYSEAERDELIEKVNSLKPDVVSIVDTFGAMYLHDLEHIFIRMDEALDKDISIGLHSHDNLGLSCALAELMVMISEKRGRDIVIDGSLMGMGRGAGNAPTELLADFLNKRYGEKYDLGILTDIIEEHIIPIKQNVQWGYDLPMMICGSLHSHVDNVYYLEKENCSARDMYNIIKQIPEEKRARYGKGYSKTDFSELQAYYERYKTER